MHNGTLVSMNKLKNRVLRMNLEKCSNTFQKFNAISCFQTVQEENVQPRCKPNFRYFRKLSITYSNFFVSTALYMSNRFYPHRTVC